MYISSLYFRISELAAASVLMRAGKELYDSSNEFENGCHIEGFAKGALAFLRLLQFKDEMGGLYQKYLGEKNTQNKSDAPENTGPDNTQKDEPSREEEVKAEEQPEGENLKPPTQEIQVENPSVSEGADSKDLTEAKESEILSEDTQQEVASPPVEETKIEDPLGDTQLEENPLSKGSELETPPQVNPDEETPSSEELKLNDSSPEELS